MKVISEYFSSEEIQLYPGIIGVKVNKVKEEEIEVNSEEEIENIIFKEKDVTYVHNSAPILVNGVYTKYVLPKPLKLFRLGVPKSLDNPDQIVMEYITFFDKDYVLIGIDVLDSYDKPFVVLEFDEGFSKVILKDEFAKSISVTAKIEKQKKKKKSKKAKRKKSAKRSGGKQKTKSKGTRKSRRV